jgi:hypothetical protein
MKTLLVVLALCFVSAAFAADNGPFPKPSEAVYAATGSVNFYSPDFGAAATLGVGYNTALNFSYSGDRTTIGLKTSVLTAKIGQIDVTGALEGIYSSAERLGGRAILGAGYKDLVYAYAAPGNFWDSGVRVKVVGILSAYGNYGGWDRTAGLQLTNGLHYVQIGYSRVHGFVLGAGAAFSFR